MNAQIINYLPAGAVAPSEKAGLDFELEMLGDAIAYHQNGDEDDAPCCDTLAPCETRIFLVDRVKAIAARISGASDAPIQTAEEPTPARTAGGSAGSTRRIVADPASEAQLGFIAKLAAERHTDKIGTFPARTLAEILDGQPISKGRASSLITALKNALVRDFPGVPDQAPAGPRATAPQVALIRRMAEEQGRTLHTDPETLTKEAASDLITAMMEVRNNPAPRKAEVRTGAVVEDGMYRTPDGEIYKVQIAKQGSGRLYAKKLVALDEPRELKGGKVRTHEFAYEQGALQKLTADMKMTLEQAKEWGKLYGTCCKCGAALTDEKSIAAGIGPICESGF
jgi:hypothetical protein